MANKHPRTWEAQFQAGIKTIALIAVREGVIQLGSISKGVHGLIRFLGKTETVNESSVFGFLKPFGFGFSISLISVLATVRFGF
ncbi:hypothetical protein HanOQP8_Chr17g0682491 [Helianthus annuus]|nr:hypothetical protein HanOQP8_Chr17g0682491 [Helianthus annuus]